MPLDFRNLLVLENGFDPKNPLWADKGEGWTEVIIKCLDVSITSSIDWACLPHKMKTMLFNLEETISIAFFVKISHPRSLCEFALSFSTVKTVFKSKTPWLAHDCRFPELGIGIFKSDSNSLKIF